MTNPTLKAATGAQYVQEAVFVFGQVLASHLCPLAVSGFVCPDTRDVTLLDIHCQALADHRRLPASGIGYTLGA